MNTIKKTSIGSIGEFFVPNEVLIERLNMVMKKENLEVSIEWKLLEMIPPYNATDIWYVVNTEINEKEEITCSKLLEFYDVLKPGEITQKEYFRKLKEDTPILEKYAMTNIRMGESMPLIGESLYHEMKEEDKRTYDDLPEEVIVYRGASNIEPSAHIGQSWTLDKDLAGIFAWCFHEHSLSPKDSKHRVVLKAKISKEYIFAYTSQRSEAECIVKIEALQDIEIYQKYSKENAKHASAIQNENASL